MATLEATLLEQPPAAITEAVLYTDIGEDIEVQQGSSVNNIEIGIYVPGYDWYGNQSNVGLKADLCVCQIKSFSGTDESDSLLEFEMKLQPVTYESGAKCQGKLRIYLSATPTQTLAVEVNDNIEYRYDVQLGFFEQVAGEPFIFTSHRGKIIMKRKGSEPIVP